MLATSAERNFAWAFARNAACAVLPALGFQAAMAQAYTNVFTDDFSGGTVRSEWSSTTTALAVNTAPSGQRFLGPVGTNDGFSSDFVQLTLAGVRSRSAAEVCFDLYVIRSMDSNKPFTFTGVGSASAPTVLVASFSNTRTDVVPLVTQGYPSPGSMPQAGARAVGTLGYSLVNFSHVSDTTYGICMRVPYYGSTLTLSFSMTGLQPKSDESWGLDNVTVNIWH